MPGGRREWGSVQSKLDQGSSPVCPHFANHRIKSGRPVLLLCPLESLTGHTLRSLTAHLYATLCKWQEKERQSKLAARSRMFEYARNAQSSNKLGEVADQSGGMGLSLRRSVTGSGEALEVRKLETAGEEVWGGGVGHRHGEERGCGEGTWAAGIG